MAKMKIKSTGILEEINLGGGSYFDYKKPNQKIEGEYIGEEEVKDNFGKVGSKKIVQKILLDNGEEMRIDTGRFAKLDLLWKSKNCKPGRRVLIDYKGPQHCVTKEMWNGKGDFEKWAGKVKRGKARVFKVFNRIAVLK